MSFLLSLPIHFFSFTYFVLYREYYLSFVSVVFWLREIRAGEENDKVKNKNWKEGMAQNASQP
jgi:hypothetical protein